MKVNLSDISIPAWMVEHGMKVESGIPFDFRGHPFTYDIIRDLSPKQVLLKAAQVTGSTAYIFKTLWLAEKHGFEIGYILPTHSQVYDFVNGKVNRVIAQNPHLQSVITNTDSVDYKRVGTGSVYYRGTFTERAAIMVSLDLLVYDEEDRMDQTVKETYASRLQHSKYKWEWRLSNPSFPGHGVDRYWLQSDQKHWFHKCSRCNERQYLKWPESVDIERECYVCLKCHEPLREEDRARGKWVKKWDDREYSGYWMNAMMAPWLTAKHVIEQFKTKPRDYFFNYVLGLPHSEEGSVISKDTILRNCQPGLIVNQKRPVIGVDVGISCHYVIGTKEGLFHHGKTEKSEDIEGLLHRWKDSIMVIDAGPDIFFVRQLKEKYPGRVYLCSFARSKPKEGIIRWGAGEESGRVIVDRSRIIQLVSDEFSARRIPIQGTAHDWEPFAEHASVMYRVQELDMAGNPTYSWESSTPMNHWFLASVYWRVGMDRFGGDVAFIRGTEDLKVPTAPPVILGKMPAKTALDVQRVGSDESDLWR